MKQINKQTDMHHHEPLMVFKLEDVFNKTIEDVKGNIVYRIVHNQSGKSYVGLTKNGLLKRFNGHRKGYENKDNNPLYNAINKYKIKKFSVEILAICDLLNEMDELETYYVNYFNSFIELGGYNLTINGKHITQLSSEQLSEHSKRMWQDPKYRNKLSNHLSNRNRKNWQNDSYREYMINILNSPENIEKSKQRLIQQNKDPKVILNQQIGKIKNILSKLEELNLEINEINYNQFVKCGICRYHVAIIKYPELFDKGK